MSEFRYCKLRRDWVLFAPERAKRPNTFSQSEKNINSAEDECPFEPGKESLTPGEIDRIDGSDGWRCRVVPNLYNALSIEETPTSQKDGFFEKRSGFGAHEIIIETPDHNLQMQHYTINNFTDYFTIIQKRIESLKKDIRLKHISVFKNSGASSGASLEHSHTQLIAMGFVPKKEEGDLHFFKEHYKEHQRCFFDDLIYEEKIRKTGIVYENVDFIAYCPYASKFPFEVCIVSKKTRTSIIALNDEEIYALSETAQFVFKNLYKALGDFSFNMAVKNAPLETDDKDESFRFHVKISPRLYSIAGFELDSQIFINTIMPEEAAKQLKG